MIKYNDVKKIDDDVMRANYDVTVIIPVYSQFGPIQ